MVVRNHLDQGNHVLLDFWMTFLRTAGEDPASELQFTATALARDSLDIEHL